MALTVETGAVVAGADSYISLTNANTYFTNHGSPVAWTGLSDAEKESALRYASAWVDRRYAWPGTITIESQALAWPRYYAYDEEGRLLDATIPQALKDAVCEAALAHASGELNVTLERGGGVLSEKVGPIEIEYSETAPNSTTYPYVDLLLAGIAPRRFGAMATLVRG